VPQLTLCLGHIARPLDQPSIMAQPTSRGVALLMMSSDSGYVIAQRLYGTCSRPTWHIASSSVARSSLSPSLTHNPIGPLSPHCGCSVCNVRSTTDRSVTARKGASRHQEADLPLLRHLLETTFPYLWAPVIAQDTVYPIGV
jgi:hypothetical protein